MEKFSELLEEMSMHLHTMSLKSISANITCFELILKYFANCVITPLPLIFLDIRFDYF